jgi:AcrR family transcriptional regulator
MRTDQSETRDVLLQAAVRLIRDATSPREVTIRGIVGAAGANLNAVNYHFGSKESLIREAVRVIIGDYFRERGVAAGSSGPGLYANVVRICDFLFDEPVAARLALRSELDVGGGGPSLTAETMDAFAAMVRHDVPSLDDDDVRFAVWAMTAVVHQLLLRPEGSREWLAADPRDKADRDALLERLCALFGAPGSSGATGPTGTPDPGGARGSAGKAAR